MLHKQHTIRWAAALAPLTLLLPLAAFAAQTVPPGTPVMLEFMQPVSTKTARKGDKIAFRVYTDVVVDGQTLIKQDAVAQGIVTTVHRRRTFGRRGELKIKLDSVTDVDGSRVPLDPYSSGDRFKAEGPGAAGAGALVLGPVGLVAGVFVKGKEITIDKGTRIQARVMGPKSEGDKDAKTDLPPVEPKDRAGDLHGEGG